MKLWRIKYLVASGALWFDGLGWWWEKLFVLLGLMKPTSLASVKVVKTLTLTGKKGNLRMYWPLGCIRFIHKNWESRPAWQRWILGFIPFGAIGVVNAVGLTNPGFDWWLEEVWTKIKSRKDLSLIISIFGTPEELFKMARRINQLDDPNHIVVGIQINCACPNSGENLSENADRAIESCNMVAKVSRLPISLSVSVAQDTYKIVDGTRNIVELYTINSVPYPTAFPHLKSPLAHLGGGGVSGKVVQSITWPLAVRLERLGVPVAWPSVWELNDIAEMRKRGKISTVSFGSVYICHPFRTDKIIEQDREHR